MLVVLIRHADAVAGQPDYLRRLSARGIDECRHMAEFFAKNEALAQCPVIWHSSLVRAKETAQQLSPSFMRGAAMIETPGLEPEDDPLPIARRIESLNHNLIIIGHQPYLSLLATLMVRGKVEPVAFDFPKGAALGLETSGRVHKKTDLQRWCVGWFVSPELLTSRT